MATSRKKPSKAKKIAPKPGPRAAKAKSAAASTSKSKDQVEDVTENAAGVEETAAGSDASLEAKAETQAEPAGTEAPAEAVDLSGPEDAPAPAGDAIEQGSDEPGVATSEETDAAAPDGNETPDSDETPDGDKAAAGEEPPAVEPPADEISEAKTEDNEEDRGVAASPPAPAEAPRRSGFGGMVLGGVLAAAIGFVAAQFVFPQGAPDEDAAPAVDYQGMIDAQADRLAALEAQLNAATQKAEAAEQQALAAEQAAVARIEALQADLEAAAPQSVDVDLSPEVQAALDAQKSQIAALSAELEDMTAFAKSQMAEAAAQVEEVKTAEARAKARGALGVVRAALDTGSPFSDVLPDISAAAEVPSVLSEAAESGVPTLIDLQDSFPEAARRALSASLRETSGDSTRDRLKLFLQDQIGARSLAPRDGDDPDAVLSRAEAALKTGDLPATLDLLTNLPGSGQSEFEAWAARAESRLAALNGFQTLTDAVSGAN
ncbi:MAG: hypothetical protein JXR14_13705 [Paracoccaceae bacterium]